MFFARISVIFVSSNNAVFFSIIIKMQIANADIDNRLFIDLFF